MKEMKEAAKPGVHSLPEGLCRRPKVPPAGGPSAERLDSSVAAPPATSGR